jgi:hydrogenase maturation protein HypF
MEAADLAGAAVGCCQRGRVMMQEEQIKMIGPDRSWGGIRRLRIVLRGAVQGVGFRPYVYRLAQELALVGSICNSDQGVEIEIEGREGLLHRFQQRLREELPPHAFLQSQENLFLDPQGDRTFEILPSHLPRRGGVSREGSGGRALIVPDLGSCPACLAEIFDPTNRRYRYPFTNCTHCGPRFSILESLPYDRPRTTMRHFAMCRACQAEYDAPSDRRFHAQPNACPDCGPQLRLLDRVGELLAVGEGALAATAAALREGRIVAVKGIGGFHLMVDARNAEAVDRLRRRKHREEKPLALLYPSLEAVRLDCQVNLEEEALLLSPAAPIVLLDRWGGTGSVGRLAEGVAPGQTTLGVMLPSNPLHHLLMSDLGFPVVATSGNLSNEPICIDEAEALTRLVGVADLFLGNDRPIARHIDDSVVRLMAGREMVLRRARGYAPLPVPIAGPDGHEGRDRMAVLALGSHLKNTIAIATGGEVVLSQHIGDLETVEASRVFEGVIASFKELYQIEPTLLVHDAHPDHLASHYAGRQSLPTWRVQHHYAHVLACMAENRVVAPLLGVAWDGAGDGRDGTLWGGELLRILDPLQGGGRDQAEGFERVAHWRPFPLPGGERAVQEPRRTAIGLLYEMMGEMVWQRTDLPLQQFAPGERAILRAMLKQGINCPRTSSVGRLFDAVASLLGIRQVTTYEGQAATELEQAIAGLVTDESYPVQLILQAETVDLGQAANRPGGQRTLLLDWEPMIHALLADLALGTPRALLAARFHNTLIESLVTLVSLLGEERVCLTGGCFQNRYLTQRAIQRLREEGYTAYWHQQIPPNDGGLSLGQAVAALRHYRASGQALETGKAPAAIARHYIVNQKDMGRD